MKKIWHWLLDAIAWLTQDNARIYKSKQKTLSKPGVAEETMRLRSRRF